MYWIGGGSGSGKSTVAGRIAAEHGLQVYSTDAAMQDHARRSTPADAPQLSRFLSVDMDERWLNRSPATMLETFHWFRGEAFGLIVEDLLRLSAGAGVVAEGFRLLPHLVEPWLTERRRAVWLLPTPEFRRLAFDARGSTWDIARKTTDPERALRNLLERERMFTERLSDQTRLLDLHSIEMDSTISEDELTARVKQAFGL